MSGQMNNDREVLRFSLLGCLCTVDLIMGLFVVVICMQHPASLQHYLKVTPS